MKIAIKPALLAVAVFSSGSLEPPRYQGSAQTASGVAILQVDTDRRLGPIDPKIYGQFLEHINHSVEDGLFAEQIRGAGFEGRDFETYWTPFGSPDAVRVVETRFERGTKSVRVTAGRQLSGIRQRRVFVESGRSYAGSVWIKIESGAPRVSLRVLAVDGHVLADLPLHTHYRTIAARESRGLVGHSMGGYGATRIGMKHADVFGSLYIMSPCCLSPRGSGGGRGAPSSTNAANDEALAAVKTPADSAKLPFGLRAQLASAAAWSPNPKNPPLYLDLPIGDQAPAVLARWAANAPLAFIDQYIRELKRYRAIAIDVGDQDALRVDAGKLHDTLDQYSIANTFEVYPGTHTSDVAVRVSFGGRAIA